MTSTVGNIGLTSVALTISGISTLAAASWSAPSSLVNNTGTTSAPSPMIGKVRLSFSAALTAGAGSPYIGFVLLYALDGTNLPNPPGTAAAAPSPNAYQLSTQVTPSGAFSIVDSPEFTLLGSELAIQIYNGTGVAFSGTVTPTLYLNASGNT